jgi:hypothetical protein
MAESGNQTLLGLNEDWIPVTASRFWNDNRNHTTFKNLAKNAAISAWASSGSTCAIY